MSDLPLPYQPDPDQLRIEQAYYQLIHALYARLPPPLAATPEALTARNQAALAQVAAMAPVNADEADIAAHCVATRAQAADVQLLICASAGDTGLIMKLNAQYVHMERTAMSIRMQLQRLQVARRKREADGGAADEDALSRHISARLMEQAVERGLKPVVRDGDPGVADAPAAAVTVGVAGGGAASPTARAPAVTRQVRPAAALPAGAPPAAGALLGAASPAAAAAPLRAAALPLAPAAAPGALAPAAQQQLVAEAGEPLRDLAAEADYYARNYPRRAQLIRQHGGLPPDCSFGPPDDDLVQEIITSPNPLLRALDAVHAVPE